MPTKRSVTTPKVIYRSPMGTIAWSIPGSAHLQIMWAGPGSRLRMGFDVTKAGSPMPDVIQHPGADGAYRTAKEATAAVKRFLQDHARLMTESGTSYGNRSGASHGNRRPARASRRSSRGTRRSRSSRRR